MKEKELRLLCKRILSKERYHHTLRVVALAKVLALRYGADVKKAKIAAYLHDVGYFIGRSKKDRSLSHAKLSESYAIKMGITDSEVLEAIRVHTTGERGMGLLAKVIYVADSTEAGRTYPGVELIRRESRRNLDRACLMIIHRTREHLRTKKKRLSRKTVQFEKELKKRLQEVH
ncbi:MAG TPA: HD domain-containing protein [Tissierellia bacterium]|nr:HD domain-containing protein [Tissierellia bacterium]